MDEVLLHRLAVALGLGLIVGLERGWKTRAEHGGQRPAGLRTFGLAGLLGGVLAVPGLPGGLLVLAAGLLVLGVLAVYAYAKRARATRDLGLTTEVALLATFGLGAAAVLGYPIEAAAAAVVMALLLGLKTEFHRMVARLERRELLATLQLLLIAAVIVPLLPSRDMGPWQAVNPRLVGLLVLLIAGLSWVGYFSVRVFGTRLGLILTAVLGGLSSSTAITVAYARRSRALVSNAALLGTGIALAAATMVPRLCIEVATVNASVLLRIWPTLLVLALVPLIAVAAAVLTARRVAEAAEVDLDNPLQLRAALVFGLLLSVIPIISQGAERAFGATGVYATAALAGLADVDAIALSLARAAGRGIDAATAERAVIVAVLSNTAVKALLAGVIGGCPMLRWASSTLLAALAAAAVTAVLTLT